MSARIYSAGEARGLLSGITPGRWTTCLRADLCVVVDDGTEEGGDGDPVAEILITDERPSRNQMADALLLAAAPDLAASVAHHAGRADAAEAEVARLRAIIDGRTVPPTYEEAAAHRAAGGGWLITHHDGTNEARWVAVMNGCPCAWPVVAEVSP